MDILDYTKNREKYKRMGINMPKGILLHGPPGTGKTLFAKAAANEASIPVIYASGSEFVELYVGLGAKRIRDMFTQARAAAKNSKQKSAMIFIDEIDAVGYQRKQKGDFMQSASREAEITLNQLLSEMDGFQETDAIFVVAATNLIGNLDSALLRPGRFDHKIKIELPNLEERQDILKIHLRNKKHSVSEDDIRKAASMMANWTGADIHNVVNLSALESIRHNFGEIRRYGDSF